MRPRTNLLLVVFLDGDFDHRSASGGIGNAAHEEPVEVRGFVSVFAEGYPNLSAVYGSYEDFGHTYRDSLGWGRV